MTIAGTAPTGNGLKNHTFPVSFIETPYVVYSAQCHDISTATYIGYVDTISNTGFRYIVKGINNEPRVEGVRYTATGKWK